MVAVLLPLLALGLAAGALLASHRGAPRRAVLTLWAAAAVVAAAWLATADPFDLRKLAGGLLMPLGVIWMGVGGLALWLALSGRRLQAAAAGVLWLLVTVAGNGWVARAAIGWLERPYTRIDPLAEGPFDAVLVLGGGLTVHDHGQITLGAAGDRVVLGARLVHAGRTPLLITSGPPHPPGPHPTTTIPELTATLWRQLEVPADAILRLDGPRSTLEEIRALETLTEREGWRRVGLVTSAWHMRRAMGLCRRHGVHVTPLPCDFLSSGSPPRPQELAPSVGAMSRLYLVWWEVLGAAVGR